MNDRLRAFEIRGADAEAALDWLHVHADVAGAVEDDGAGAIVVWLHGTPPPLPFGHAVVREIRVPDASLHATGLENDAPIRIDHDLLVRPPWVERPEDFAGVELIVPRGGAFGSGEHASTKAALRCLHRTWDAPASVADVGTGSGILALYARVRGCVRIEACDVDESAVRAARELLPDCRVLHGDAATLGPADCVVANMTGPELRASMAAMLGVWTRVGVLVLSGMRANEVAGIEAIVGARRIAAETVADFTSLAFR